MPDDSLTVRLSSVIAELGDDVVVEQHGPFTAFSRGRRFAQLEPHAGRVDLALVLPEADETERLRPSDGFGTHLVSLAHEDEIDGELTEWLRAAYADAAT